MPMLLERCKAAQEAQSVGILALTGVVFTAAVKSAMMASSGRFSAPGLGLYALIGLGIGTAASSFLIYSFFSNLKKREKGYSGNDIGNPQLAQLYLQQQRQLNDPQGLIDPLN